MFRLKLGVVENQLYVKVFIGETPMQRIIQIFLIVITFLNSPLLNASQEGIIVWSSFVIESTGIDSSGPMVISGKQNSKGILSLKIKAFSRDVSLNDIQLNNLRGMPVNGMRVTYETGDKKLGGKTLYIVFSKGFTSGTQLEKVLEFNEEGEVSIKERKSR